MSPSTSSKSKPIREPVRIPEPAHDVARVLKELMHSFRTIVEGRMRSRGHALSFAHALLLMSLAREPGLSGAQAARRSQVTAQTMNSLLRNLEAAGYAVREPNPENRRADRWFLTEQGLRHLERGKGVADEVTRRMLVPLATKDVDRLCALLQKCAEALRGINGSSSIKSHSASAGKRLVTTSAVS
jgi:DNA-binding MarR family transcriptional regulator